MDKDVYDLLSTLIMHLVPSAISGFVSYQVAKLNREVKEIHKATNSMKDELVASTKEGAHLQGYLEGIKDRKHRSEGG
jgi:predicted  nucleic acid-binding Zn-ribbon protein